MHVLDHHDGGVDHGADGDGDALRVHDNKRCKNAQRQTDDNDKRGSQMKKKQRADQRDDNELFQQFSL